MGPFVIEFLLTVFYGFVGLGLMIAFYLIIDRVTHFSIKEELSEKQNSAVAILLAGVAIALAIIIAAVVD